MASMYLSPEHFIQIAAGNVHDTSHINKFGYNPSVGSSYETVHDGSNLYSYPSAAAVATVAGASDAGAVIEIQGLDADYNLQTENVTVGSSSTGTFIRVFRARIISLTSGNVNAGDITITVDGTVATIKAGNGQTLMAVYTIPKGKTGYLIKFQGSVEKGKECEFKIMTREPADNGFFNVKGQFGSFGVPVTYDYPVPLKLTAMTDIEVRSKAGAVTGMGAIFDIILVDN